MRNSNKCRSQQKAWTKRDLHYSMEGCAWSVHLISAIVQIHGERIVSFLEGSTNASEEELSFQNSKHVLWPKAILGNATSSQKTPWLPRKLLLTGSETIGWYYERFCDLEEQYPHSSKPPTLTSKLLNHHWTIGKFAHLLPNTST